MKLLNLSVCAAVSSLALGAAAYADDAPAAAAPAAPAAPAPAPLGSPAMSPTISANPAPASFNAGPLGNISVGGAITGIVIGQDHHVFGDHRWQGDISNGQVWVEKTDGVLQFFVEAGAYSLPTVGVPYIKARTLTDASFDVVPVAYVKLVPNANFNIMVGKLPTLVGAELGFTFQNININRGLLWNQEPLFSRGVQANFTKGPLSVSFSVNDGYYSKNYTWLSGLIAYTVSPSDTISFVGAGNAGHTTRTSFTTPLTLNNSSIYNLIWTHTSGPVTITPYVQYSHVSADPGFGYTHSASTYSGAILAKYSVTPEFSLAARGEYLKTTGSVLNGAPNLLYGPGSKAWSLTFTPGFQRKLFFLRGEIAYVKVIDATPGFALGPFGLNKSQVRVAGETGVVF